MNEDKEPKTAELFNPLFPEFSYIKMKRKPNPKTLFEKYTQHIKRQRS
jgi:predicted secreted protein